MNELKQGKERAAVLQRQLDTSLPNVSTFILRSSSSSCLSIRCSPFSMESLVSKTGSYQDKVDEMVAEHQSRVAGLVKEHEARVASLIAG